jgi:ATP-dependent 26S proteasome regulatory subunit
MKSAQSFLNELDGFAKNDGILALTTTNHPERLDTAIIDLLGRFDHKYHFDLPGLVERYAYIAHWNAVLQAELQVAGSYIASIVEQTEAFPLPI